MGYPSIIRNDVGTLTPGLMLMMCLLLKKQLIVSAVQSNLTAEIAAKTAADGLLSGRIVTEIADRGAAVTSLNTSVTALQSAKFDKVGGSLSGGVTLVDSY